MEEKSQSEFYKIAYRVLKPEIQKIKRLHEFHEAAVREFTSSVDFLVGVDSRKEIPSPLFLGSIVSLFDAIITLDALKSMKACLSNDFTLYKRYDSHLCYLPVIHLFTAL